MLTRGSLEPSTCRVELHLGRARYPLLHGGKRSQRPIKSKVVWSLVDVESAACAFLRSLDVLNHDTISCTSLLKTEMNRLQAWHQLQRPEWPSSAYIHDTEATCKRVKREYQSWFNCRPILQWDHKNWSIDSLWWSSPRKSLVKGERFVRFEENPELPLTLRKTATTWHSNWNPWS